MSFKLQKNENPQIPIVLKFTEKHKRNIAFSEKIHPNNIITNIKCKILKQKATPHNSNSKECKLGLVEKLAFSPLKTKKKKT